MASSDIANHACSQAELSLDLRGLLCPLPVIRVQESFASLREGERVRVLCTDPGTRSDLPAWCRIHGHLVKEINDTGGELVFVLEVGRRDRI